MTLLSVRVAPASALPGDETADIDAEGTAAPDARDPRAVTGHVRRDDSGVTMVEVVVDGWRFELEVEDAARAELRRRATRAEARGSANGPAEIRAIIPGRVAAVRVVAGDQVTAGQGVLVVEAMKMQNELRAPRDGTVERVAVGEGETIEHGDLLVVLR